MNTMNIACVAAKGEKNTQKAPLKKSLKKKRKTINIPVKGL